MYELLRDSGDSVRIVVISLVSTPLCSFNCHQDCYSSCGYTQFFLSFPNQSIVMSLRLFVCFSDCLSLVLLLSLRIFVFRCVCVCVHVCPGACAFLSLVMLSKNPFYSFSCKFFLELFSHHRSLVDARDFEISCLCIYDFLYCWYFWVILFSTYQWRSKGKYFCSGW